MSPGSLLRVAFVAYEFPPETAGGGIGTYLDQITAALARYGHDVHVFCGGSEMTVSKRSDGVHVHRIRSSGSPAFSIDVIGEFLRVHAHQAFDACEGTDFDASALGIKRALPDLPYVVKLHTPRFVIDDLHYRPPRLTQRLRMAVGALRRGQWPKTHSVVRPSATPNELDGIRLADEIAAPSIAIAAAAESWVPQVADRISIFPYPYEPANDLLSLPATGPDCKTIGFIGRLEERKGVIDLADAIPAIVRRYPAARVLFVGKSMPSPKAGINMAEFLRARIGRAVEHTDFVGAVPADRIPKILRQIAILIAPSHWESFGLVCCEGLAAGRAVVGSSSGGMAEILDHGRCGVLVPPHRPDLLAAAVIDLLANANRRETLGKAGRNRIQQVYSPAVVLQQQLASYDRAIARCKRH